MGFEKNRRCRSCGSTLIKKHPATKQIYCFVCCDGNLGTGLKPLEVAALELQEYEQATALLGRESGDAGNILARLNSPGVCPSYFRPGGYDVQIEQLLKQVNRYGDRILSLWSKVEHKSNVSREDIELVIRAINKLIEDNDGKTISVREDGDVADGNAEGEG